ncbi:peptidase S8/S53 domain-containing protein [Mycena metata]|uniref:Peptidase S8/S53 domain-containing protein n=1 Tax=Mycena metata TaxID=1033252 RepID=A0AAD7N8K3_9AGAR|nr:peptidase S8/S53 domain-containing protein [Mycena metata]
MDLTTMNFPSALRGKTRDWTFTYDDTWGHGVFVYVADSGVRDTHTELAGRVLPGYVLPGPGGAATEDVFNHGTGVASLIAGATLGIATKQATIVPVRIADGNRCDRVDTSSADAAAGVNWAVSDYKARNSPTTGIINISWQVYNEPVAVTALTEVRVWLETKVHVKP